MIKTEAGVPTKASKIAFMPDRRGERETPSRRYDALVKRYFEARALDCDEDVVPGEDAGELIADLMMTPAPERRHLKFKMSLFAEELAIEADAETPPMARTMAFFAAIQADLLRFIDEK
jgi:hypothetical protein